MFKLFILCNNFDMSKYKIINLVDKLFITTAVFLIIYAWINFFIRDLLITFVLSLIFSFGVVSLIFYLYNRKKEKRANTKKYLTDVEQKFLAFRLLPKTSQLHLLYEIIKKSYSARILIDSIVYKKDGKTCTIIIETNVEKINNFNIVNLVQGKQNVDEIEIICNDYESIINKNFLSDTNIKFTTKKGLYDEYFFKHSIYPNCSMLNTKNRHVKIKQILKNFIMPSKAKSYFLCGLILIFSSIILPYHIYYLIFGSILLILSIACKLQPLFKR